MKKQQTSSKPVYTVLLKLVLIYVVFNFTPALADDNILPKSVGEPILNVMDEVLFTTVETPSVQASARLSVLANGTDAAISLSRQVTKRAKIVATLRHPTATDATFRTTKSLTLSATVVKFHGATLDLEAGLADTTHMATGFKSNSILGATAAYKGLTVTIESNTPYIKGQILIGYEIKMDL